MSQLRWWCEVAHGTLMFDAHVAVFTEQDTGPFYDSAALPSRGIG